VKKNQNGRKSLRRLKPTVGCNTSKRRSRYSLCAPDDGWRYHPKNIEQFPDINKLCKVESCGIYIGIYLGCTDQQMLNFIVSFSQNTTLAQ
jgi:hypothetical protein